MGVLALAAGMVAVVVAVAVLLLLMLLAPLLLPSMEYENATRGDLAFVVSPSGGHKKSKGWSKSNYYLCQVGQCS